MMHKMTGVISMPKLLSLSAVILLVFLLGACALDKSPYIPPERHPVDAELPPNDPPICIDCHEARDETFNWAQFNHTNSFVGGDHRQTAYRQGRVCQMCHTPDFCSDCHATRIELKPSERHPTQTYRRMPHRGDYLSRHRIDGRVDPSSCFRCHGNPKTALNCSRCHS